MDLVVKHQMSRVKTYNTTNSRHITVIFLLSLFAPFKKEAKTSPTQYIRRCEKHFFGKRPLY